MSVTRPRQRWKKILNQQKSIQNEKFIQFHFVFMMCFFYTRRQHIEYWILLLCQRMMYIFMCHFWNFWNKKRTQHHKVYCKKNTQTHISFFWPYSSTMCFYHRSTMCICCATFQGLLRFFGGFSLSFNTSFRFTTSPSSHMNRLAGFSVTLRENDESCDSITIIVTWCNWAPHVYPHILMHAH